MADKLIISKKDGFLGEDGYRIFSIRAKESTLNKLEKLAKDSGHSRNALINLFLEYGLEHYEIEE